MQMKWMGLSFAMIAAALFVAAVSAADVPAEHEPIIEALKQHQVQVRPLREGGYYVSPPRGGEPVASEIIELIVKLGDVHTLSYTAVHDADLAKLGTLVALRRLTVTVPDISDAGVAHLASLTELEELTLRSDGKEPRITPDGLRALKPLAKVTKLGIGGHNFPPEVLVVVPEVFPDITYMDLNHTFRINAEAVAAWAKLDKLERLGMGGTVRLSEDTVAQLANIKSLKSLNIFHSGKAQHAAIAALSGHPSLEEIQFGDAKDGITDEVLAELSTVPNLRRISTGGDHGSLTDEAGRVFASMPELRDLHLSRPELSDKAIAHLAAAPKLETLTLSAPNMTDEALRHVAKMKSLTTLELGDPFRGPQITDAGLKHLHGMTHLKTLRIWTPKEGGGPSEAALNELKAALGDTDVRWRSRLR